MADFVFNIAKGAAAQLCRANPNSLILSLLRQVSNAAAKDADNFSALFALTSTKEAVHGSYARKTGLAETITVDDTNDRVDLDVPDQTWTALSGSAIVGAVVGIQTAANETGRIPLTYHDFAITPDGSDVTLQVNASGFYRAS